MNLLASVQTRRHGIAYNAVVTVGLQLVVALCGIALDTLGFSEATVVIIYVLGVLLTAVFTTTIHYCLAAAVLSILSFNYYFVEPRFSFRIEEADVPGTMVAMFAFALVAGYLVMQVRTSEHKSAEARLMAQNEQLRADLLRSVSHDLRTPLTSISGNADMLLDNSATLSEAERLLLTKNIYEDATWLTGVVENLLMVTRFEHGRVSLSREVELLDDVVEDALRHVSPDASKHDIEYCPASELLLVRVDGHVMVQVVVNLVNNAITHTQGGSHIKIMAQREGEFAIVSVEDNGPGISPEDQPHIFEPFYTTRRVVADGRRGFGLGLPLCRAIVEAHGGTLCYRQAEPHGTVFSFSLPLEEVSNYE